MIIGAICYIISNISIKKELYCIGYNLHIFIHIIANINNLFLYHHIGMLELNNFINFYIIKKYFMLSNYVIDISSLNNYSTNVYINQNEDILCNENESKIDMKTKIKTEDIIKDINSM